VTLRPRTWVRSCAHCSEVFGLAPGLLTVLPPPLVAIDVACEGLADDTADEAPEDAPEDEDTAVLETPAETEDDAAVEVLLVPPLSTKPDAQPVAAAL
jgi:hypothetical protein